MFGKKIDLDLESNTLKFDTPKIYITVIAQLVGGILLAQICYHV